MASSNNSPLSTVLHDEDNIWYYRVANSTPMVLLLSKLNSFRVKRDNKLLFPTPESPINTTATNINRWSIQQWHYKVVHIHLSTAHSAQSYTPKRDLSCLVYRKQQCQLNIPWNPKFHFYSCSKKQFIHLTDNVRKVQTFK